MELVSQWEIETFCRHEYAHVYLEETEGMSHVDIWDKIGSDKRSSKCKSPDATKQKCNDSRGQS